MGSDDDGLLPQATWTQLNQSPLSLASPRCLVAEKTDAVRRLMAEQAGSPKKNHGENYAVR